MRKKLKGGHGGHGWFVTFADLMALLMSFFVMVAAYSTQDQKKLQLVAGSMRDAFGTSKESRYAGIIEQDGIPTKSRLKNARQAPPEEAAEFTTPNNLDPRQEGLSTTAFTAASGSRRPRSARRSRTCRRSPNCRRTSSSTRPRRA